MLNWFLDIDLKFQLFIAFSLGALFGIFLMNILVIVKNKALGAYKRQLEKEAIAADESVAKIKVLEAKIKVLEKALDNALNNK